MAELADAYGSGPYECKFMQVQVLLPAPEKAHCRMTMGFFNEIRLTAREIITFDYCEIASQ